MTNQDLRDAIRDSQLTNHEAYVWLSRWAETHIHESTRDEWIEEAHGYYCDGEHDTVLAMMS